MPDVHGAAAKSRARIRPSRVKIAVPLPSLVIHREAQAPPVVAVLWHRTVGTENLAEKISLLVDCPCPPSGVDIVQKRCRANKEAGFITGACAQVENRGGFSSRRSAKRKHPDSKTPVLDNQRVRCLHGSRASDARGRNRRPCATVYGRLLRAFFSMRCCTVFHNSVRSAVSVALPRRLRPPRSGHSTRGCRTAQHHSPQNDQRIGGLVQIGVGMDDHVVLWHRKGH